MTMRKQRCATPSMHALRCLLNKRGKPCERPNPSTETDGTGCGPRMARAPLATALAHLDELAVLSSQPMGGTTLMQLAAKYQEIGWKVDQAAMKALAAVSSKGDADAVGAALRAIYVPWLAASALHFQELVKAEGKLSLKKPDFGDGSGICTVFVDGLRYDAAMQLMERFERPGQGERQRVLDQHALCHRVRQGVGLSGFRLGGWQKGR